MKWNNYVEFVRRNPELRNVLDELVSPERRHDFQGWIEHEVHYIAVRPWASFRMDSRDSHTMRHVVYFHTGNKEYVEARTRYLRDPDNRGHSVGEIMKAIVEQSNIRNDRTVTFDAVVCVHRLGFYDGYRREAFEIFVPQEGFMP